MTDPTFINISERAYKYIRQFTIKTVDDAFVELITNCSDAYNKTEYTDRLIEIEIIDTTTIKVRDRALGLTSAGLEKCFLQLGDYTATYSSRGFFSRGAKDISALGNVYFRAIKDNKFSECLLNTDAYGMVLTTDIDATNEHRTNIGIPDSYNGLEVELKLLQNFYVNNPEQVFDSLCKLGVLRDILMDSKNNITFKVITGGITVLENRISYQYPPSTLLLDIEYAVPNYEQYTAKLVIYKTDTPFPQPTKESEMEFGFLIKDSSTIYEVNTVDSKFRWNPYINYVYGYIKCDAIKELLIDYDTSGVSDANPYPIIDPSRLTGVNKIHPFIENLFTIPLTRIDLILRELNKSISSKSVTIDEIDDLLSELSKLGVDIIEKEDIEVSFLPNYDSNLIKAINDDRSNYVTYENSYLLTGNYNTEEIQLENYIQEQIIKIQTEEDLTGLQFILHDHELVQLQDIEPDILNDPVNVLNLIPQENIPDLETHPYIYSLSETGDLSKLYVFQKGIIDNLDEALEKNILSTSKQFKVEFINDLNILQRFIIDSTDGIVIKVNLNNPIIKKYMTTRAVDTIDDLKDFIRISNIKSTQTLTFFQELMTDILTDIVVESDVTNGKLVLDSDGVNNARKLNQHRQQIITNIEISIDALFSAYIQANYTQKMSNINTITDQMKAKFDNPEVPSNITNDLYLLESDLSKIILSTLE